MIGTTLYNYTSSWSAACITPPAIYKINYLGNYYHHRRKAKGPDPTIGWLVVERNV